MNSLTDRPTASAITLIQGPFSNCPTAHRHRGYLNPQPHDRLDGWTRLIPEEDCNTIITELETALEPTNPSAAVRQAEILIGSYPAREVMNADIFVRAVTSILAEAPVDVGRTVVDDLTRSLKWLPTRAEVAKAVSDLVQPRRRALQCARDHLREHARRKGEGNAIGAKRWADLNPSEKEEFNEKIMEALSFAASKDNPNHKETP